MRDRDGNPAFPQTTGELHPDFQGMSLRDWFAGQALMGFIANGAVPKPPREIRSADLATQNEYMTGRVARSAYGYADAMLKVRDGK